MSSELSCRRFSFDQIKEMTNNFADYVGHGGFGTVYRGVLPDKGNSTTVAVKRLSEASKQGDPQFQTEIEVLSKCHHRHIVTLIGYCDEQNEKILVYEYVPGGSLFHYLHRSSTTFLTIEQRLEICLGVARGLDHLHSGTIFKIIHRDVKTADILLDEKLQIAKISDLGLAKVSLVEHSDSEEITEIVRGTRGYLDPQYSKSSIPSTKSDVYAFGVVLLEVLCRRQAWEDNRPLVEWALPDIKEGGFRSIIDPDLVKNIQPDCLLACAAIITKCLEDDIRKRHSMSQVVADLVSALERQRGTYPSSSVIDSEILNHFKRPHLDTINETDGNAGRSRKKLPTTATSSQRKRTETKLPGAGDGDVFFLTTMRAFLKICLNVIKGTRKRY